MKQNSTPVGSSSYSYQWVALAGGLLTVDALAILSSLILAYTLRISSGLLTYHFQAEIDTYFKLSLVSVPVWLILFGVLGLYRRDKLLDGLAEYKLAVEACTGGMLVMIVVSFMWRDLGVISRGWLTFAWVLSCGLVTLGRFLVRRVVFGLRQHGWFTARVLIVGANDQGIAMARQWCSTKSGMQVVGFVDDFKPLGTPVYDGLKVIGRPTALSELARQTQANEVVVVPNAVAWETFEEIIARASTLNGYTLRLSPGFYEMLTTGVIVTNKSFVPLLTIDDARIVGVEAFFKMLVDYGLGLPLLVLTFPLMALIAAGLKLVRPGEPILTRYQTIGQGGATFSMHKFNTRLSLAEAEGRRRSTPLGRVLVSWFEQMLYRTGLDKLPQFLNIVRGQMSLVGPRPRVINEDVDPRTVRHLQTVKPGITGPWILADQWAPDDEIQNELYYVRNWTIWLDMQILSKSVLSWVGGLSRPIATTKPPRNLTPPIASTHMGRLPSQPVASRATHRLGNVPTGDRGIWCYDANRKLEKQVVHVD